MTKNSFSAKNMFRPLAIAVGAIALTAGAAFAGCYYHTGYFAPDMLNCKQVDETNMGIPIWRCCS